MIAPKVLFPNDKHQYSCRRYPSLTELLVRRFYLKNIFKKTIQKGIYTDRNLNQSFNPDYLTGCFHLYKTEDFIKLEGFDEQYFLYIVLP
jgi:GT2 family glycosyltransferase